jgi:hypothetical protein
MLDAGEVGIDAAAVVGSQRQQLGRRAIVGRTRGRGHGAGGEGGRQGVANLLQTSGNLAAPLWSFARVG